MTTLLLLIVLPLTLIGWLGLAPQASATGLAAQAAGTGLMVLALGLVALWPAPLGWARWAFGVAWAAALGAALLRGLPGAALPGTPAGWGGLALALGLTALGGWGTWTAIAARTPPAAPAAEIATPLGPGRYIVGQGGFRPLLNGHMKTLDTDVPRFRAWRGQSYGADIIGLSPPETGLGTRPADPADYPIFGAPVLAPCGGTVLRTEDGLPDMTVPEADRENLPGNHVLVDCGGFHVLLAHLRQGSVSVAPGDRVWPGARLGAVGNSGNTSEPHLHVHAQRPGPPDAPFAGDPLPLRIDGAFPVRNTVLTGRAE